MLVDWRLRRRLLIDRRLRRRLLVGRLLRRRLIVWLLLLGLLVVTSPLLSIRLLPWEQGLPPAHHIDAMLDSLPDGGDGIGRYIVDQILDLFY